MLEYCGGGDLGQFIQARGPSPEATARHFMLQLAAGLTFLRSRQLIHRDIKPQNLLLSHNSSRASLKVHIGGACFRLLLLQLPLLLVTLGFRILFVFRLLLRRQQQSAVENFGPFGASALASS